MKRPSVFAFGRQIDLFSGVAIQAGAVAPNGAPRRFDIQAYDGGPLPVAGFDLPVIVDLATLEAPESMPLLIDHEATVEATLGSTDLIENNGQTMRIAGLVTATSQKAVNVVDQFDKGQRWQASIGVRVGTLQEVKAGQVIVINKQQFRGPVLVARNSQMFETSVLPAGADWTTTVNLAARAARLLKGSAMNPAPTFEEWLATLSIDPAALDENNRAALSLAYDAVANPGPAAPPANSAPPVAAGTPMANQPQAPAMPQLSAAAMQQLAAKFEADMLAASREKYAKESERIQKIEQIAGNYPNIRATAVREGWDEVKTENHVLKEQARTKAPDGFVRGSRAQATDQVIEAAVCMVRKIPGTEKRFNDQTLQAAHDNFRGGIGLQQMLLHAACANGYDASPGEKIGTNLRAILKAAFSTVSLPGILSNIANKELLAGYESDESLMLWKEIAQIKSVSDFKTVTAYRMLDSLKYEELGAGGKIKHGTIGEEYYTRQAKTYARMFSLTRTDIINDDLGAFDDLRNRLGLGGATALSDVFWTKFLANPGNFFSAANGNYISGSTTNLGTDFVGLQLALDAFRNMKSPTADGLKRIGGEPEILLVPTELTAVSEQIYKNLNYGGGTTVANANIHANKYRPVVVPWLSDSTFPGYSSTAFYLFRKTSRYAPMTVSFLNGQQQPTVESADADFDTLGVEFRGYHDFGCDVAEYVAGVKSKGAA